MAKAAAESERMDLTIDELARETGMTARNIRAHQSRGLLPPPEVRSRTGYYGTEHVTRIRLIQDMQGQGFNLKSIERLLHLGSAGGAEQTLQFERLLLQPFGTEQPEAVAQEELGETFGDPLDRKLVAKAERIGALRPIGEGIWEVPSPTLLRASRELVALGIPLEHALAVGESITKHTTAIAREFVRLFVKDVLDPIREGSEPSDKALATAAEALERLRPLASEAVLASFGQVMTAAVERQMAKELG
ncbi:MAG: MerR family transcriptional regulator [Solirubrobacterales bacterium]|nr:MerR family transcriptional regulator [Solirubrobacterales bacterium]MCB8970751.1 MerR family transcriptional regulator [Thermoleophilales bacterium]